MELWRMRGNRDHVSRVSSAKYSPSGNGQKRYPKQNLPCPIAISNGCVPEPVERVVTIATSPLLGYSNSSSGPIFAGLSIDIGKLVVRLWGKSVSVSFQPLEPSPCANSLPAELVICESAKIQD